MKLPLIPKKSLAYVIILGTCLYCLFVNKPIHNDSELLIQVARQTLVNPVNPPIGDYGRRMAIHGSTTHMPRSSIFYRCPHPPFLPLLMLPVTMVASDKEWAFHLFFLCIYISAIIGGWYLFRLFLKGNALFHATLLWSLCPALFVNSHNIMYDVPICSAIVWTLALFLTGIRKQSRKLILFSGIIAGVGALTKMTIAPAYGIIIVYFLFKRKWYDLFIWALPALILPLLWVMHNIFIFGKVQYLSTGHFNPNPGDIRFRAERIVSLLSIVTLFPVMWLWIIIRKKEEWKIFLPSLVVTLLWGVLLIIFLNRSILFSTAYAFYAALGLWILWHLLQTPKATNLYTHCSSDEKWACRVFIIIYFIMCLCLPLAAARFLLPLIPFIILFLIDFLESFPEGEQKVFRVINVITLVVFTISLSTADYLYPDADRKIPHELAKRGYTPEATLYHGNLSYDYYLYHAGYRSPRLDNSIVRSGIYFVEEKIPFRPVNHFIPATLKAIPVDTISLHYFPFRTIGRNAGFYGNSRLPFSIECGTPQKRYLVYKLVSINSMDRD
jgi:hypothetical protein